MTSVYGNPEYSKVQAKLLKELERLKKEYEVPALFTKATRKSKRRNRKATNSLTPRFPVCSMPVELNGTSANKHDQAGGNRMHVFFKP